MAFAPLQSSLLLQHHPRIHAAQKSSSHKSATSTSTGTSSSSTTNNSNSGPHRRRRSRPAGGSMASILNSPSTAVHHAAAAASARRSRSPLNPRLLDSPAPSARLQPLPELPPAPTSRQISLPRVLPIPKHLPAINPDAVAAVDPDLEGVPVSYVVDRLSSLTPHLLQGIASVVTEGSSVPSSGLPTQMEVAYRDSHGIPPTHIIAAINPKLGKGYLFPAHELVLVAQLAHLPALPPSDPQPARRANHATTLTLPVVPLPVPHPESFGLLHDYLYTKRHDRLVAALLPLPYSALPPIDMSVPVTKRNLSAALAKTFTLHALVERARVLHGFWSNLCALGVVDEPLWKSLEIAWGILIDGMGMASSQVQALSQPQSQPPLQSQPQSHAQAQYQNTSTSTSSVRSQSHSQHSHRPHQIS